MTTRRRFKTLPLLVLMACVAACSSGNARSPMAQSSGAEPLVRVDDDVLRARVAVADLLRAMNARDMTELEARYAIRARTRELAELAHMLDRATGPSELRVYLLDDPTVTGDGAHPVLVFVTEFRWRSAAGLLRTQKVPMRAPSLREGGMFLIASVLPQGELSW